MGRIAVSGRFEVLPLNGSSAPTVPAILLHEISIVLSWFGESLTPPLLLPPLGTMPSPFHRSDGVVPAWGG